MIEFRHMSPHLNFWSDPRLTILVRRKCECCPGCRRTKSVNKSTLTRTYADTLKPLFFFNTCRLCSRSKPSLKLPVFLRVSANCIHMLLREGRIGRGDCLARDKNHLAPSEGAAIEVRHTRVGMEHRNHVTRRDWRRVRVHAGSCSCFTARLIGCILSPAGRKIGKHWK